ncbi:hypothetical protein Smp_158010 [Schistosoma mansoni]|uniref:hypothetical protein n=1 Tax=Schistosoma mansoni TaxID=6183 RepID=UPI00022DC6D0|nr:hypothetical protein Smp_158010 [Schistosoma mansoni]|eukprot:XP_018650697.1 hypothetical protein Smp_158010 [Schistosoma mansoni]
MFERSASGNRTAVLQHSFSTVDQVPLHQPPCKVPVQYQQQLNSMIKETIGNGVMVPSLSSSGSDTL